MEADGFGGIESVGVELLDQVRPNQKTPLRFTSRLAHPASKPLTRPFEGVPSSCSAR